ncbi:MAG: phosphate acyltransferase PlsX [Ruminococcaceae bacterium]|nr:phosphate acyltransferase PlsX [Oscillospiraceae bacterium]
MKIIVDAMGGDNAPQAIVQGVLDAHRLHGIDIVLVGRAAEVLRAVEACGETALPAGVEIRNATEVVEISDDPAIAFKMKKDSSLTVGMNMLKAGEGDAFVSAGSTGALLAGATLLVKRIRGIRRAAMGPVIPTFGGKAVLCDCGANADCTAEYLLQFAYLGSYYAKRVLGVEKPRVALLNIGAEAEKGDALRHEAHALLKEAGEAGRIHFVGNIEAGDAMLGGADVIVADGFAGNVMLKSVEGTAKFLMKELKGVFYSSAKTKLGALLVKKEMAEMKKLLDPSEVGGTPFLGISKPVLKAHGSSDARAICNAVLRAKEYAESGFIADIEENVDAMKVDRGAEKVQAPS